MPESYQVSLPDNQTVSSVPIPKVSIGSAASTYDESSSASEKFFLGALMAMTIIVSFFFLSRQSLRLDEAQSLWQSARSPAGIMYVIAQDVHVPFYLLLLHFWQFLFGNQVAVARVLSLVFFIASIPAIFKLGALAYNKKVAWFATILTAVSPFLNWYGNEIRMYSLMLLLAIISHIYFLLLFKFPLAQRKIRAKWWVGYTITGLLGIYTHYFFWFVLLGQAIFFFIYQKNFVRGAFLKLTGIAALLIAVISPWLYYVLFVVRLLGNSEPLLTKPTSIDMFNTFSQFLFGFQTDHVNTLIVSLWPLTVLLAFWAIRKNNKVTAESIYFLLATFVPIFSAFAVSLLWKPLFLPRYLIFSTPTLYLLLGSVIFAFSKNIARILQVVFIATMAAMLVVQIASASTPVKEDYKGVSNYLSQTAQPQDIVLISAPFTIYPIEYYYDGSASLVTLPIWDRYVSGAIPSFSPQELQTDVSSIRADHNKAYLVLSYDQGYQQDIKNYFDAHFQLLDHKNFSPNLDLYVYNLKGFSSSTN